MKYLCLRYANGDFVKINPTTFKPEPTNECKQAHTWSIESEYEIREYAWAHTKPGTMKFIVYEIEFYFSVEKKGWA